MTAGHTPGPWKFDPHWALIEGPAGEEIAAVHAAQDGTRRVHPQTAHANARLIASAPDLLAALEFALEMQESVESVLPEGYGTAKNTALWMEQAKSIIAAAKGEK